MNYQTRSATTEKEIIQSKALARDIFKGNLELKNATWELSSSLKNFFIAVENEKVIGLIRIIPMTMFLFNREVKTCCLTSICISKSHQGKGLLKLLMKNIKPYLESQGYEFAFLIARKAVDYVYQKFDFKGVSSYQKVNVEEFNKDIALDEKIFLVEDFNEREIEEYNALYESTYLNLNGSIKRSYDYWKNILKRLKSQRELRFFKIRKFDQTLGYLFIYNGCQVVEISFKVHEFSFDQVSLLIKDRLNINEYRVSHKATFLRPPSKHSLIFLSRSVPYGGHMGLAIGANSYDLSRFYLENFNINFIDEL